MSPDLAVRIGSVTLKNPLICGAGEHVMEEAGLRRAIASGAAAVVIKSTNESAAAKDQLLRSAYAVLDSRWNRLPRQAACPADASLLCRSGLAQQTFEDWLALVCRMDALAARQGAYAVASLIPANLDQAAAYAARIEKAGVRVLEVNIGAPHGDEAAPGAISLERTTERVAAITRAVRATVSIPLWIKLTGQAENIPALALAARAAGADAVGLMGRLMGFLPDPETMTPVLGTHAAYGGGWALPLSCHWLAKTRPLVGADYPLIGTNGARTGLDVIRFLLAGASAVQMTTAIALGGFDVVGQSLREIEHYLVTRGVAAAALVGRAADASESYAEQPLRPENWRAFAGQENLD